MSESELGPTRIGHAERESAIDALDVHLNAGRLDAEEYGERVGRVSVARTLADLQPLFTDLPAPHPAVGPVPAGVAQDRVAPDRPVAPASRAGSREDRRSERQLRRGTGGRDHEHREALGGRIGESIVGISPILATILFFATNGFFDQAWLFFLLIPLAGALVYGRSWRGE